MSPPGSHKWEFKARFRRHAFGWRSQPAILRIREAVREIRKVSHQDPILAADGAVAFLERLSPALEQIDSSSGAIGTAVNKAVRELVKIIAAAPADPATRDRWLERLWTAHEEDDIPYIETLADYWGDLCVSKETASRWADRLIGTTRLAFSPEHRANSSFDGSIACLSSLFQAGRYAEIIDLVPDDTIWYYWEWAERARAALAGEDPPGRIIQLSSARNWSNQVNP